MSPSVEIAGRSIGPGRPCFIIAEAGVNHDGRVELAERLIDAAAEAGVDAVKFQTFRADEVAGPQAPKAPYQWQTTDANESQLEMIRRLELPAEAFRHLQRCCRARGVLFLSTPFDAQSVELLETMDVPAFKVASGELTNGPLLEIIGRTGRPILLSTGMASLEEVSEAVAMLRETGHRRLVLLHCVSCYPAEAAQANLRAMRTMAETFGVPVGYSDHTLGSDVALAAVALGACVIEKHVTLDRRGAGPDHCASLEPQALAVLVRGIRAVEAALGHGRKEPVPEELRTAAAARRSLVAARDLPKGTRLTEALVAIKRPGTGLPPAMRPQVVGRTLLQDLQAGALLSLEMVQ